MLDTCRPAKNKLGGGGGVQGGGLQGGGWWVLHMALQVVTFGMLPLAKRQNGPSPSKGFMALQTLVARRQGKLAHAVPLESC